MKRQWQPFSDLFVRGGSLLRFLAVVIALAAHGTLLLHQFDHALHPTEESGDCTLCHFASTTLPEPDADPVQAPVHVETLRFSSQHLSVLASAPAHHHPPARAPPYLISA